MQWTAKLSRCLSSAVHPTWRRAVWLYGDEIDRDSRQGLLNVFCPTELGGLGLEAPPGLEVTFTSFQRQMAAMFLQRYKDLAKNSVRNRSYPCIPETWDVSLDGIQPDLLIVEETGETVELGTLPGCRYAVQEAAFVADWSASPVKFRGHLLLESKFGPPRKDTVLVKDLPRPDLLLNYQTTLSESCHPFKLQSVSAEDIRLAREFARNGRSVISDPRHFPYEFRVRVPAMPRLMCSFPLILYPTAEKDPDDVTEVDISLIGVPRKEDCELSLLACRGGLQALPGWAEQ